MLEIYTSASGAIAVRQAGFQPGSGVTIEAENTSRNYSIRTLTATGITNTQTPGNYILIDTKDKTVQSLGDAFAQFSDKYIMDEVSVPDGYPRLYPGTSWLYINYTGTGGGSANLIPRVRYNI